MSDEILEQKRIITKLGKRLAMMQYANKALAAHNFTLVTLQADRGINCERIIRGDHAEAKLARIKEILESPHPGGYAGMVEDMEEILDAK